MANPRFDGSGVALVTPFRDGAVNEAAIGNLIRFHHSHGTDALVMCGSTGEAAAMTPDEQYRATVAAVEANAGRLPIIVGCGGTDTRAVVQLAIQARRAGADAVLLSAPPYNKPPQRGIIEHFRAAIDAADLPAIIYNVPGRTSVNILPATLETLADDPRVIGVKEASGDIVQIAETARLVGDRIAIWSGNDDQVVPVMALGGRGVITVLGNIAPQVTHDMVHYWLAGDHARSLSIQLQFLPLIRALFAEPNPIPVKAAVGWLGFDVGDLRAPLAAPDLDMQAMVVTEMERVGLTPNAINA